jgi:hypothetical protein
MSDEITKMARLMRATDAVIEELDRQGVAEVMANIRCRWPTRSSGRYDDVIHAVPEVIERQDSASTGCPVTPRREALAGSKQPGRNPRRYIYLWPSPRRQIYLLISIAYHRHYGWTVWFDPVVLRAITISWNKIIIPDHGHLDDRP